jgi:hypothetical protein
MAMKNTYRFARICLFLLLAIVLLLAGRWAVVRIQHHKAYREAKNSMVLRIDQSKLVIEAGDSVSLYDAVTASGGTLSVSGSVNTAKTGSYPVVYSLRTSDRYGREILKKRSVIFTVEDTAAPVIALKTDNLQIAQGADFNPAGNVAGITDAVNGPIDQSQWQITSDVNVSQPGTYQVTLEASDASGQYVTDIVDDILFHSVPYFSESPDDLEYEEYNKLGTSASLGCVRLQAASARWIYVNCPLGTTVEFYDDAGNPGPFGKPDFQKIDVSNANRGWDPTDPDPANPWLK